MGQEGIDIAVPFPTLGLYTVDARDPELNHAVCRAYNDWLHEEYLAADRRRLIGIGMLTLRDVGSAVEELRRVHGFGFKGIYLRPLGNTVYIMPPYCIPEKALDQVYTFLVQYIEGNAVNR